MLPLGFGQKKNGVIIINFETIGLGGVLHVKELLNSGAARGQTRRGNILCLSMDGSTVQFSTVFCFGLWTLVDENFEQRF